MLATDVALWATGVVGLLCLVAFFALIGWYVEH
jgi:hypothetical protein